MTVTATEAKNRFGQVLDDALRAAVAPPAPSTRGDAFYARHRDWFDAQNELVERHGIPGEEHRPW
jgi:hypothetical protein